MNMRRPTSSVLIGNVLVGSKHPIRIQSMTNTRTSDTKATIKQVKELYDAGSELVRLTVNDDDSAASIPKIKKTLEKDGYFLHLIGEFHFNGQ